MQVRLEPQAAAADIQVIKDGLRKFNVSYIGPPNEQAVQIFLRSGISELFSLSGDVYRARQSARGSCANHPELHCQPRYFSRVQYRPGSSVGRAAD